MNFSSEITTVNDANCGFFFVFGTVGILKCRVF